jgi:DNA-binding transcriptional LysR family regulator
MQELRHITAFREVTRSQSFSEASRRLKVTPAAISRSIAKLEDALGVRLLNRTTRNLQLTDEGRTYLSVIEQALDSIHDAEAIVQEKCGKAQGVVRISVPVTFGRVKVLPALADFLSRNPELELDIIFDDLTPNILEHSLDLALQFGEPLDPSHIIAKLYTAPVFLAASPTYLERYGAPRDLVELAQHQCMPVHEQCSLKHESFQPWQFVRTTEANDPDAKLTMLPDLTGKLRIFNQFDLAYSAAKAALGIIAVDLALIKEDLISERLKVVLPDYCIVCRHSRDADLSLVYPHRNHLPLRVKIVKDFLVDLAHASMREVVNPHRYSWPIEPCLDTAAVMLKSSDAAVASQQDDRFAQ